MIISTSDSVNDRGNEIVSPRLDPVQSTSCFCSAHGLSLLVPRVKYGLPTACRNSPTVCGNSPAACGNFHPRLLLQGFFQSGNRLFRVFFFFEQSDELTADDSSGSLFASCLDLATPARPRSIARSFSSSKKAILKTSLRCGLLGCWPYSTPFCPGAQGDAPGF